MGAWWQRALYNLLFHASLLLSVPYYGWRMWRRGNWRQGFGERFGFLSRSLQERLRGARVVWFHAVSVGEVRIAACLLRQLAPSLSGWKVVVSTTTTTGRGELERLLPTGMERIYCSVDAFWAVQRSLRLLHPEVVVLVEAEIWPNLLWQLSDRRIPVFLVNARVSERSAARYRKGRFLFAPLFASLAGVGVQNERDRGILPELGCRPERVRVTGNLKFDASLPEGAEGPDPRRLLRWAGAGEGGRVLMGSSTHPGEERMLGEIFLRLQDRFPDLFLVMVPRHFERGGAVGRDLRQLGIRTRLRSESRKHAVGSGDCLVLDSTGELRFFYPVADVVVIGKSFLSRGGQSPVEAAAAGTAIVIGPHMENFRGILECLEGCLIRVPDAIGLERELGTLLADGDRRRRMGERARREVERHRGAVERSIRMIRPLLDPAD